MIPAKEIDGELWVKASDHHQAIKEALAQPEQEPVAYYHPHKGFYWAKPTSISAPTAVDVEPLPLYAHPPQRTEQNFCSRCGKRTADLTTIHTCTPPQD